VAMQLVASRVILSSTELISYLISQCDAIWLDIFVWKMVELVTFTEK
jgi:hypothetical protein